MYKNLFKNINYCFFYAKICRIKYKNDRKSLTNLR